MDTLTRDETPDMTNQRNPLVGCQIFVDHKKALSANPLDIMVSLLHIMVSLLHIKLKHPSDSPILSDTMIGLFHIKGASSVFYDVSVCHHHQGFVFTQHHLPIKGAPCL